MSRTSDGRQDQNDDSAPMIVGHRRLARLLRAARAAIVWDRLWPALLPLLGVIAAFIAVSLLGLWLAVPFWARGLGLGLFALAALAALWPLRHLSLPSRGEALARVDRGGTVDHRPATAADDRIALGRDDPAARALWAAHQARAAKTIMALPVPTPSPNAPARDPYALRAMAGLAVVASLFIAGPEWRARLASAFDFGDALAQAPAFRLDGWIDPPLYTRMAPLVIDLSASEDGKPRSQSFRAPTGSIIVIRAAGRSDIDITVDGGITTPPAEGAKADTSPRPTPNPAAGVAEQRFIVKDSGSLDVAIGGTRMAMVGIDMIPDMAPSVTLNGQPRSSGRDGLDISYTARDDYGFAALDAIIEPMDRGALVRALVPPPKAPLTPPADPASGEAMDTRLDLADHPWAGANVRLSILAIDEAGQEGRSESFNVRLPQRPFVKPLAKALVEQRRNLIMDKAQRPRVQTALDAIMIAPDLFSPSLGEYLGLTIGATRVREARSDEDLIEAAEYLWQMALRIEEGDLSQAEQELRAAQEALREALERGADPDEIAKLTQQLRQAMDKFLREFAEKSLREQRADPSQPQRNQQAQRMLSQRDLNRMLDRMQELAKNGSTAEAQRLLEQLKNLLNNLQTARPGQSPRQQQMEQSLNELDELTREQEALRDRTFQNDNRQQRPGARQSQRPNQRGQQQGQRQRGQQGQQGEQGEGEQQAEGGQGSEGLRQRQEQLRQQLEAMRRRMEQQGMEGNEGVGQGLGDAEDAMRQAEQGLGQGDGQGALDAQGRALDGLRRGAQALAQQMQPGEGEGEGEGQAQGEPGEGSDQPGSRTSDRGQDTSDPLGRPTRNLRANENARFDRQGGRSGMEIRIDEVIRELRRRLGDPGRDRNELDYLERLLRPR